MYFWPQLFKSWIALSTGEITIQRISVKKTNYACAIQWIVIYPVDSVIHLLINWGQYGTTKALSTLISFCWNYRIYVFFFSGWAYRHRNCIFSKTFSRVEIFEKGGFSFTCTCVRTKTEIFQYDDVTHHVLLLWRTVRKGFYPLSFFLAFSCGWAEPPKRLTCGFYFEATHVFYIVTALKVILIHCCLQNIRVIFLNN